MDFLEFKEEAESGFAETYGKLDETVPGVGEVEDIFEWQVQLGEKFEPSLRQCVASFEIGRKLNLAEITARVRTMNYNPQRFNSAEITLTRPPSKLKIAASGKCTILGCKSEDACEKAAKKTAVLLRLAGVKDAVIKNYRITNMTLSVDLKVPIRLGELHRRHSQMCTYEPSIFPGLRFNLREPKCVASIFVNGKINITGLRVARNANIVVEQLFPVLKPFMGAADGSHQKLIDSNFGANITKDYKPREAIKKEEPASEIMCSVKEEEADTQPVNITTQPPGFYPSTYPGLPPTMTPPTGPTAAPGSINPSPGLHPSTPGLSSFNMDVKDEFAFRLDDGGARSGSEDAMGGWGVDSFL